ncbi:transcription factor SRM1-like isoform X2 [Papaver somniferum]|nr:transcription factor SRM1-like isoform X2 [Papaver somniferum]
MQMTADETSESSTWSREQDKAFENALAIHPEGTENRWEKIAVEVTGKTLEDVKSHYDILVEDISGIEAGLVPVPCYVSSPEGSAEHVGEGGASRKDENSQGNSNHKGKASRLDQERRKGIAWTEEEHRLFLLGLEKYGKGDWRSISRNYVVTRTPTQVASHAQKYFIRLSNSMNKDRRRSSIHDITGVGDAENISTTSRGPITGQANGHFAAGPRAVL